MTNASYPALRMRRGRSAPWMRAMLAEHRLHPSDLILPLFVCEGEDKEEPIASLPGVSRWSIDRLAGQAKQAASLGIPCVALFPNTPPPLRTEDAREALNRDNLVCRAIEAIKESVPEIGVLTDVALDPYTSHGHDGLVDERGNVLNDETVAMLAQQALVQAAAGADIVAPSDMMDGRVGAIRTALEGAGHGNVAIMAYAAKYASAFYGPFRDAVGSAGRLKGDKRGYQMDPANGAEALREVALDLAEGADMVMVKPGLAYLDVLAAGLRPLRRADLRLCSVGRICDDRGGRRGWGGGPRRADPRDADCIQARRRDRRFDLSRAGRGEIAERLAAEAALQRLDRLSLAAVDGCHLRRRRLDRGEGGGRDPAGLHDLGLGEAVDIAKRPRRRLARRHQSGQRLLGDDPAFALRRPGRGGEPLGLGGGGGKSRFSFAGAADQLAEADREGRVSRSWRSGATDRSAWVERFGGTRRQRWSRPRRRSTAGEGGGNGGCGARSGVMHGPDV